jgi:hypothetical protein
LAAEGAKAFGEMTGIAPSKGRVKRGGDCSFLFCSIPVKTQSQRDSLRLFEFNFFVPWQQPRTPLVGAA